MTPSGKKDVCSLFGLIMDYEKTLDCRHGKIRRSDRKVYEPGWFYNIIIILYSFIQRQNGRNRAENEQISERIN